MKNDEKIRKALNLRYYGKKGWMKGQPCPICGNNQKFGIKVLKDGGIVNCQVCGYKTSLFNYLKSINRLDLINHEVNISLKQGIVTILGNREVVKEVKEQKSIRLPLGFKVLKNDVYLDNRGFLPEHYIQFNAGETKSVLESKLIGKKIFCFYKDKKLIAWMARSTHSKIWHDKNLKLAKKGEAELVLRYENSESEFNNIVGGIDEVNEGDKVIGVEGIFDKINVDKKLGLKHPNSKLKCVFFFGKTVSEEQLIQLKAKNINLLYLMLDSGTTLDSKKNGLNISRKISTKVCKLKDGKDPGDSTALDLLKAIKNSQSPLNFYLKNIK